MTLLKDSIRKILCLGVSKQLSCNIAQGFALVPRPSENLLLDPWK